MDPVRSVSTTGKHTFMLLKSQSLLDMLFDRMPMVVAVLDREYCLQRLNPTWADFAVRFSPSSLEDVYPGAYYFDIFPGSEEIIRPLFERVLSGETVRQDAVRLETGGYVSYWDIVLEPIVQDGRVVGILDVGIDATEREKMVAELREREERLDLVLRGTNDGIWDWDLETDEVYFSPRWKSMLGYREEEIPAHFDAWRQLLHPDDADGVYQAIEEHLRGETPLYKVEHRLRHKDGTYRWILARGTAVRDEAGRPRRMVGSHTDVTERRRAEEIQAGQQQFLELLATGGTLPETLNKLLGAIEEQSPGMLGLILILDEDGKHLHIGAAPSLPQAYLDSIEGLEIGPMVGSCGTASYTGERVIVTDIALDPRWDNLRDLALESGLRACWSEPVFSADGEVVGTFAMYYREPRSPTDAELRTIATGAHLAGIAIERKRADDALRESERRLSTLMSNLPGIAYRCANDSDWTMTFVSQGSMELTGYAREELEDQGRVSFGQLIHPDDRKAVWEEVQAALAQKKPFQLTYRLVTADGQQKWAWEQGRGIFDDDGELVALEGFITDATERVMMRQTLEQRVAERTRELSTLLDVSHDVASTRELEPLLGQILQQLKAVVDYDGASILVLEDAMLKVKAYRGPIPQQEALALSFSLEDAGANQAVIEQRCPIVIPDVRGEGPLAQAFQKTAGETLKSAFGYVRSWLGVPLIVKGEILGMLSLDHDEADHYTEQHSRLVLALADQVAVTIENARLFTELEQRTQALEALYHADEELYSHLKMEEVLQALVDVAVDLLRADKSSLMVWDAAHEKIVVQAARGFHPDTLARMQFVPGQGIVGRVAVSGEPAVVENVSQDVRVEHGVTDAEGICSFMHLPLQLNGEIFGVFNVSYVRPRVFDEEEQRLFTGLAQRAALAVENARLYHAAEMRADEAQTLFTVQRAITSDRERESILQLIADEARRLTGAERTMVFMLCDDSESALEVSVLSGHEGDQLLGYRLPVETSLTGRALREGHAFRSRDAQNDPRLFEDLVREINAHSLLTVPLISGSRPLGAISVLDKAGERGIFDDADERVLEMLASGAVIALENARLFEEEEVRRHVAEGLRDILSVLNSEVPLPEMMDYIVAQAVRILDADAGIIYRRGSEMGVVIPEAMAAVPPELQPSESLSLIDTRAKHGSPQGKPMIVPDMKVAQAEEADALRDLDAEAREWTELLAEHFGAYISVPFVVEGDVYGDITLYYRSPRHFSQEELSLTIAFSEQASLAVENARLRMRAKASAASDERNRLARELHDAVTQTLFSASLIAEVIPRIWEKDPDQGRRRLEELRELTRGALAEMRTLLLELRPASLTESSLPELLRQLAEAVIGRSRLAVDLTVEGEADLPPEVQVVFYRIAQESLNNVTKHAGADSVDIILLFEPDAVSLSVADDGRGFEMANLSPDSLGMGIMRERAEGIGATLKIDSKVGEGTRVTCVWPVTEHEVK